MLKEYLSNLANAFRTKLGITEAINAQSFPDKVSEVYDKGKYDEWSDFWDSIQKNGARSNYDYMFRAQSWNDTTFRPKYNIKPSSSMAMFARCAINDLEACIAKGGINGEGVMFDFSNSTEVTELFGSSDIIIVPELTISKANLNNVFYNCTKLRTIRKLIINENRSFSNTFYNCNALTNIIFEGNIGKDINFRYSPLSKESIISVIEALSGNAAGKTVTFKKTAVNDAFGIDVDDETSYTEEWITLRNSKSNWTFAYA